MWSKGLIKRPLLWIIGGYLFFLFLFLNFGRDNPITRVLYGEKSSVAVEEQEYPIEAKIIRAEDKQDYKKCILQIISGPLKGVRIEGKWPENLQEVPGTRIFARVVLKLPQKASNPGEFNAWLYYKIRRVDYLFTAKDVHILERGGGIKAFLYKEKEKLAGALNELLPKKEASMVKAILLGCSGGIDPEIKNLFQKVGIAHIFAISGLHIMMLYGWTAKLTGKLIGVRRGKGVSLIFLWMYTLMTGSAVSTLRAAIMISIKESGTFLYQEEDPILTIGLAAFLLLLWQPLYLLDAGFQLSFGAVLCLRFIAPILKRCYVFPKWIREKMSPSLAVSVGTGPITLWHFFQICPYGVLLNWLVVPLMNVVLLLSGFACMIRILSQRAAQACIGPVFYILKLYSWMGEKAAGWPGSIWILGRPSVGQIVAFYGILVLIASGINICRSRRISLLKRGGFFLFFLLLIGMKKEEKEQVSFLNVGQGDCAVIEWKGEVYIVDAGTRYESVIRPYLLYSGITEIDGLFLSHFDEDHVAGAEQLLRDEELIVKSVYVPNHEGQNWDKWGKILNESETKGVQISYWNTGDRMEAEGGLFCCISPDKEREYDSENDGSMILLWSVPGIRILFTGDAGMSTEQNLPPNEIKADILKVAHHGSKTSTGDKFLEAVAPELAIISSQKAIYGHPHKETTDRLRMHKIPYGITEEAGAITVFLRNNGGNRRLDWINYQKMG